MDNFKSYLKIKMVSFGVVWKLGRGVREILRRVSRFVAPPLNRHMCFLLEHWKNTRLCGAEFGQTGSEH